MPHDNNTIVGLAEFRQRINDLDDALIDLLARRLAVCTEVANYKRQHNIAMMQPDRVVEVKERCAQRAIAQGLEGSFARDLYDRIIGEACALETRIIDA